MGHPEELYDIDSTKTDKLCEQKRIIYEGLFSLQLLPTDWYLCGEIERTNKKNSARERHKNSGGRLARPLINTDKRSIWNTVLLKVRRKNEIL
jgi:hypothetical protein